MDNQTPIQNDFSDKSSKISKITKKKISLRWIIVFCVTLSILVSLLVSTLVFSIFYNLLPRVEREFAVQNLKKSFITPEKEVYQPQSSQESVVINAVKNASPAVVSIIISKYVPIVEQYYVNPFEGDQFFQQFFGDQQSPFQFQIPQYRQKGVEKQEVGGGTGFVISADGLILTNKHVVIDEKAEYTVLTNDGKKYTAKILARDPIQDLAVLKIDVHDLPVLPLGDSDNLQIGQSVIAIGNALGEFRNTVSVGVISGLQRSIEASGTGIGAERISEVIQTDASINPGNSGGPLLNLRGEVIGINVAMVQGAQNIGFAIPANRAKKTIESVKKFGKVIYPFLGVRYIIINKTVQEKNKLPVDYGALVVKGSGGEVAITTGSPAEKAGIKEGDIILEVNGIKVNEDNHLGDIIQKYNVGDEISLKILRNGEEMILKAVLAERK